MDRCDNEAYVYTFEGCGDGGGESSDGGAASASPRVEEPPPTTASVPPDVSPTADSWEVEADDALLTPEENNEPEEEELDTQVGNTNPNVCMNAFFFFINYKSQEN